MTGPDMTCRVPLAAPLHTSRLQSGVCSVCWARPTPHTGLPGLPGLACPGLAYLAWPGWCGAGAAAVVILQCNPAALCGVVAAPAQRSGAGAQSGASSQAGYSVQYSAVWGHQTRPGIEILITTDRRIGAFSKIFLFVSLRPPAG